MSKTAYIAGPVSGHDSDKVIAAFNAKEVELLRQGYRVNNPVAELEIINYRRTMQGLPPLTDATHRQLIMQNCVAGLALCDEVHMLPGWQFSEGAQIEHKVAELLKLKIVYP